ncbi:hypothetical protein MN116_006937 [Schistosoma mekongi]|uniref:BTB domain-containing protein n=1 Tax=Schistosoma mekongi TaxID=38744 RepID=A0AAE1Z914_SCHME|nr:hypothetical protein MN116_006937 [Schistosoma mekongi]
MVSEISWQLLKQATILGLAPVLCNEVDLLDLCRRSKTADNKITINVSGVHFELTESLVRRYPSTLLGSDEREYFYDAVNHEYFFDRDPELFRYILTYYQHGKLHFPKNICISAFENELKYFSILSDNLSDCCYESFVDYSKDIEQRLEDDKKTFAQCKSLTVNSPTFRQKLWTMFENPEENSAAYMIYYTTGFFIIVSVLSNMAETIPCSDGKLIDVYPLRTYGDKYANIFFCVDTACVLIFTIEYLSRLYASPSRCKYMRSIMAIIDLTAVLPYYISIIVPAGLQFSGSLVTLRVFRVFRIFKFSRHSQGLRILGYTLKSCAEELGFLLFSLTLVVIIFATVIYYIERFDENSSFYSIPDASWYTIVTMTTLGYGDMIPSTVLGKIIGSICSLCGVLVIALPVPVIVSNFSRIYQRKQRANRQTMRQSLRVTNESSKTNQFAHNQPRMSKSNIPNHMRLKTLSSRSNCRLSRSFIEHGSTTQTTLKTLANWSRRRTRLRS